MGGTARPLSKPGATKAQVSRRQFFIRLTGEGGAAYHGRHLFVRAAVSLLEREAGHGASPTMADFLMKAARRFFVAARHGLIDKPRRQSSARSTAKSTTAAGSRISISGWKPRLAEGGGAYYPQGHPLRPHARPQPTKTKSGRGPGHHLCVDKARAAAVGACRRPFPRPATLRSSCRAFQHVLRQAKLPTLRRRRNHRSCAVGNKQPKTTVLKRSGSTAANEPPARREVSPCENLGVYPSRWRQGKAGRDRFRW